MSEWEREIHVVCGKEEKGRVHVYNEREERFWLTTLIWYDLQTKM